MTERNKAEDSNSLSTIDDITRRLLRPPFLRSPEHLRGRDSWQFLANSKKLEGAQESAASRARETTNRKLEDYLDPILLSVVSAKIGGRVTKKKKDDSNTLTEMKKKKTKIREFDFEWPAHELNVFLEDDNINGSVNLNNDLDSIEEGRDGGQREICTPLMHFEQTALKRRRR